MDVSDVIVRIDKDRASLLSKTIIYHTKVGNQVLKFQLHIWVFSKITSNRDMKIGTREHGQMGYLFMKLDPQRDSPTPAISTGMVMMFNELK